MGGIEVVGGVKSITIRWRNGDMMGNGINMVSSDLIVIQEQET